MLLKCCKLFTCLTVIKWLKKEEETNRKTQGEKVRFSSFYFSLNFFTFSFFFSCFSSSLINWSEKRILWKPRNRCWGASGVRVWRGICGRRLWDPRSNTAHQSWPATVHPGALSKPWRRDKHSRPQKKRWPQVHTEGNDCTHNKALHPRREMLRRVQMSG